MLRESLGRVVEGKDLDIEAMTAAVGAIMEGQATDAQIGAFLTALRLKGESGEEIAGAAMALRDRCVRLPDLDGAPAGDLKANDLIDTCGTGGDGELGARVQRMPERFWGVDGSRTDPDLQNLRPPLNIDAGTSVKTR